MKSLNHPLVILTLAVGLSGCMVGLNYQAPSTVAVDQFKAMAGWKQASPQVGRLSIQWWLLYKDPVLDGLQHRLVSSNQTLAQYEARYRQAMALVKGARSAYFPTVGLGAKSTRNQQGKGNSVIDSFDLGPSFSWELDLWGKIRRQVEAAKADAAASQADLASAKLSLQAELAQTYLQLRIMDIQQQLLNDTVKAYQKSLTLVENQYQAGMVVKSDMTQARTQLKNTEAQAIDIRYQRAQLEHALAVLVGDAPANFKLAATYKMPQLPDIPAALPAQLLERRPDIAAAEQQVIAANANIGVAAAAWYPDLTLSAAAGYTSNAFRHWVESPSRYWSLGPQFAMTLFDGGLIKSRYQQAEAAYDEKVANYRQTVLNSFREVEDYLVQLAVMTEEKGVQADAVSAAQESLQLILNQYEAGLIDYLNVASAQTAALNTQRTQISLLGSQLTASVKLMAALGGGWDKHTLGKE